MKRVPDMEKETAPKVSIQEQHNKLYLTGKTRERAIAGNEIINLFFKESNLKETVKKLDEILEVINFIKSKNQFDIDDVIEIVQHAKSYAANIKNWSTT